MDRLKQSRGRTRAGMVAVMLAIVWACATPPDGGPAGARGTAGGQAKNIVFMVADGMGLADVTAARIFKHGPSGDRLAFEKLPVIGYQRTHSADSTVTDSAAAASAWASGEKFNNGEVSCHDEDADGACDGRPSPTLLDLARAAGKATGLVATADITHATPAAFAANVHHRDCEETIARHYLSRRIDVLLGGGMAANRPPCRLPASSGAWLEALKTAYGNAGYAVVATKSDLHRAVAGGAGQLLGLFKAGGKSPEAFRIDAADAYPSHEPTLAEMTAAALALLERRANGFFLVVEGSQIDWANHSQDIGYQIAETLAFEAAVDTVLQWAAARPDRLRDTLIVVVADHETGGFAVTGPYGSLAAQGDIAEDGWTGGEHTAVDTLIWAQGPAGDRFGRALDNTDLYSIVAGALH